MIVRRYVYDPKRGVVVELGEVHETVDAREAYSNALGSWQHRPDEGNGQALRNAALERADRRVHAYRRYGTEARWSE